MRLKSFNPLKARFASGQQDGKKASFSICECMNLRVAPSSRAADRLLLLPLFRPKAGSIWLPCSIFSPGRLLDGRCAITCGRSPSVISTKHEATRRRVSCPACRRRCVSSGSTPLAKLCRSCRSDRGSMLSAGAAAPTQAPVSLRYRCAAALSRALGCRGLSSASANARLSLALSRIVCVSSITRTAASCTLAITKSVSVRPCNSAVPGTAPSDRARSALPAARLALPRWFSETCRIP